MSLEQHIASKATLLGFAAVGFASLARSESFGVFEEWLKSGGSAGMDYLRENKVLRSDPRVLAQGAKSVIVVAARYSVNKVPGRGFSSFVGSKDYHHVIRTKLHELAEFIRQKVPISVARVCVDSAPLLEREWAVRAGIGWRGRQGQIVNRDHGCCIFLGELLVDAILTPSTPVPNQCGKCRDCIDACPNTALRLDGLIDAWKCASYLTIEHKGEFTVNDTSSIGKSIFGCDVCTAICPWNPDDDDGHLIPDLVGVDMPDADACFEMTQDEFLRRFEHTAVFRTGLERLKRNAAAVIKNCSIRD